MSRKTELTQDDFIFQKWNSTTALCFHNHMICENCNNQDACNIAVPVENEFGMKNVKFATLMTMRNCGLKGLRRYLQEESDER